MEMCEYLVNHFSELLEIRDNDGWTVLHSACRGGSVEIVSFHEEKGLDLNAVSNIGESILHIACFCGKFEICEFLVENHPNLLDVRDRFSNSVLHDAARGDLLKVRDINGWTVLHSACRGGSLEIVSFLIEKGLDLNALSNDDVRDRLSNSVLHDAAWGGSVQIVKLLIEKGMDTNTLQEDDLLEIRDNNGWTVLHSACSEGDIDTVFFLIEKGLDLNALSSDDARDRLSNSVLHDAAWGELLEIRDNDGWTVLHSACSGGAVEIVSFLKEKGLDVNALSNDGESILHITCLNGKHNIASSDQPHESKYTKQIENMANTQTPEIIRGLIRCPAKNGCERLDDPKNLGNIM
ncbi:putative ankyrin repeat protein RF_0381 [Saccostrea echinata]|uniref:putative ankyrin repeat protein RF_0381 n=1 Tax=Saccostrea echinata TaxID=191078 RepID=UPI002A7FEA6E|nr:putative ankyrin repeat protein RF_0381 [Saccostrea echinata]